MAKTYKSGSWSKNGRVMPGKRTKEKRIDQLLENGEIVVTNKDQKFSPKEFMDSPRHCVMVHEWFVPKKGDREVLVMDGDCHVMAYQYDIGRCGKFFLTAKQPP